MNKNSKKTVITPPMQRVPGEMLIGELESGIHSPFWRALSAIIKSNLDYMDQALITGVFGESELTDVQLKNMRKWRGYNAELLSLPEKLVTSMRTGAIEPENLDPYYSIFKDIIADKSK